MIDFPQSPTLNQVFTSGGTSWVWDGTKWQALSSGWTDAPTDGFTYGRKTGAWSTVDGMPALAAGQNSTGRNLLHNPMFSIQQRGTGPWATAGAYTADRWRTGFLNDTISFSLVTLTDADRTALGDESAQTALQNVFTGSATAGSYNAIIQFVENVRRTSNRTVTVSFWAKAATGTPGFGVNLQQSFGTGGSPSAAVSVGYQYVTLSTGWTRYSLTYTVPSIAGKVLGTNNDHSTQLTMSYSIQGSSIGVQSGTVQIWGPQLEYGNVATSLAKRDPPDELALCQRFYVSLGGAALSSYASGAGQAIYSHISYPVQMRAVPTVTTPTSGITNCSTTGATNGSVAGTDLYLTSSAAGTFYGTFTGTTASADL